MEIVKDNDGDGVEKTMMTNKSKLDGVAKMA
jgi:hypothetical protein